MSEALVETAATAAESAGRGLRRLPDRECPTRRAPRPTVPPRQRHRHSRRHKRERDGPAPELRWAWRRLSANQGRVEVGALAKEVGWSRRHLGERFRREFGLAPKVAARVMRFEATRRLLGTPRRPGLAQVAVRCGYADQAHLTREWRELAGCTPSSWLAEEFPSVQDTSTSRGHSGRHD